MQLAMLTVKSTVYINFSLINLKVKKEVLKKEEQNGVWHRVNSEPHLLLLSLLLAEWGLPTTDTEPRGAMREAGANPYAAKLPSSPSPISRIPYHHSRLV